MANKNDNPEAKKKGSKFTIEEDKIPLVLEIYKQAHETRRKWEGYIWQYGVILTVLAAFFAQQTISAPTYYIIHKVILSLVTLFVFAIFTNVLRARSLMKESEKTIEQIHIYFECNYPVVPLELNRKLRPFERISSTKIAAYSHFIAFLVFLGISIYAWLQ